jgi:hypothetical protein
MSSFGYRKISWRSSIISGTLVRRIFLPSRSNRNLSYEDSFLDFASFVMVRAALELSLKDYVFSCDFSYLALVIQVATEPLNLLRYQS